MINIKEMAVTDIQFFDHSEVPHNKEAGILEYSANVILDGKLLVQLSGNQNEAHPVYIPSATEQHFNYEDVQDWATINVCRMDLQDLLDELEVENNLGYLRDNATESTVF